MTETVPWPWPGDTELEKRERVARDYRNELNRIAPDVCARMDAAAHRLGQHWITPAPITYDLGDWITIKEAATMVGRTPRAVRYWTAGEHPRLTTITDDDGIKRVRVRDLIDLEADLRRRRANRAT